MPSLHALEYLADPSQLSVGGICALFGDEPFLKRLALIELRKAVVGQQDGEFSLSRYAGGAAEPREVFDELSTVAMFGGDRRMVVVDDADDFVSRNRATLEDYVARPSHAGTLVLVVDAWPSNTRLAKAVATKGVAIECKQPPAGEIPRWLVGWAKTRHAATLERDAADLLLQIVGPEMGLLDQELAKLAAAAGAQRISPDLVEQYVGGWRVKTTWDMLDAACEGKTREALSQLDSLLLSGESPIALLGQIGFTLRRFATAARLVRDAEREGKRTNLRQALEAAGVKPYPKMMDKAETQLRRLGRHRAAELFRWGLEADLALKGSNSSPPRARILLEQLVTRLGLKAS